MKVTSLVDNVSNGVCEAEHGLSLYVELDCGKRILFDFGQGDMFARNAIALGIDIAGVDMAVISHGHYDHGGGLETFLRLNSKATVYLRRSALDPHYSVKPYGRKYIGLADPNFNAASVSDASISSNVAAGICCSALLDNPRFVFCRDIERLPDGVILFSNPQTLFPEPPGNDLLLNQDGLRDDFAHEQSMIIFEDSNVVLFGGCAHCGIANVLTSARKIASTQSFAIGNSSGGLITAVFSGTHIAQGVPVNEEYVAGLAKTLLSHHGVHYWTMHCTGEEGYRRLAVLMGDRISYLTAGSSVILQPGCKTRH